jgi:putative ATPase
MKPLSAEDLGKILRRALGDSKVGYGRQGVEIGEEALRAIAEMAEGDARQALNLLEQCVTATAAEEGGRRRIGLELLEQVARRTHLHYDRSGDAHFDHISALHKSLRASDAQAAVYWLARMLVSGEDPLYIGRRLVRFASEDVGLADPQALPETLAAVESYRLLGSPEGELALVQATLYLATCPKSDSLYRAWQAVTGEIESSGSLPPPMRLRNAPTRLMKALGYGEGYVYDHERPEHFAGQFCLPDEIRGRTFYAPGALGFEKEIGERLAWWEKRRREIAAREALRTTPEEG